MAKKILHIVGSASYDGTAVYSLRLAESLNEYESLVLFLRSGSAEDELKNLSINYFILNKNKYISKIVLLAKFKLFLMRNRFDIIHYHSGGVSFLLASIFLRKKAKVIFHIHCGNINCKPASEELTLIEKKLYSFIDKYSVKVAAANHIAENYKNYFKEEIPVINNAVPFQFKIKNNFQLSIGYLGQIKSFKNIIMIRQLAEVIKKDYQNLKIIIKGEVSDDISFINQYKELIILEKPSFGIQEFFNKIDILFFPSESEVEGAPLVLFEALCFDAAVIAKKTKAVTEVMGDYALLVEEFSSGKINDSLKLYYSGKINFNEIHSNILKKYSYTNMLSQIKNLYKSL